MITLKNINKYYHQGSQRFHVLHDINIEIDQGELVAIIGESGSGKSTLINIIGFLDDDFEGTYFYQDHPILDYTRKQFSSLRNQNVGFVFQSQRLRIMSHYRCYMRENPEKKLMAEFLKRLNK